MGKGTGCGKASGEGWGEGEDYHGIHEEFEDVEWKQDLEEVCVSGECSANCEY